MSVGRDVLTELTVLPDGVNAVVSFQKDQVLIEKPISLRTVSQTPTPATGRLLLFVDSTSGTLCVRNSSGQVTHLEPPAATEETPGLVQLATNEETLEGVDVNLAVTPAGLKSIKGEKQGIASLDSTGIVPLDQMPASVVGALAYQGQWNAASNIPVLISGVGFQGQYYEVSIGGETQIDGTRNWLPGDWIVFNGIIWQKNSNIGALQLVDSKLHLPTSTDTVLIVDGTNKRVAINKPTVTNSALFISPNNNLDSGLTVESFDSFLGSNALAFQVQPELILNQANRRKVQLIKRDNITTSTTSITGQFPNGSWMLEVEIFTSDDTETEVFHYRGNFQLTVSTGLLVHELIFACGNLSDVIFTIPPSSNEIKFEWTHSGSSSSFTAVCTYTQFKDIISDPMFVVT